VHDCAPGQQRRQDLADANAEEEVVLVRGERRVVARAEAA
jgi:hypothetical protein